MGDYLMSLIKANDIQNASGGIPTVKSQQLIPTAWVNFNGTGTVAIRGSENVSSITDRNTGAYTVNYTVAMANVNYCATASQRNTASDDEGIEVSSFLVGSTNVFNCIAAGTGKDSDLVCVSVIGEQA